MNAIVLTGLEGEPILIAAPFVAHAPTPPLSDAPDGLVLAEAYKWPAGAGARVDIVGLVGRPGAFDGMSTTYGYVRETVEQIANLLDARTIRRGET